MLTEFRGIQEFGFIAGISVLMAFLAMMTLFPAVLVTLRRRAVDRVHASPSRARAVHDSAPLLERLLQRPTPILLVAGVLTVYSLTAMPAVRFDYNRLNLQARGTESVVWERRIMESAALGVRRAHHRQLPRRAPRQAERLRAPAGGVGGHERPDVDPQGPGGQDCRHPRRRAPDRGGAVRQRGVPGSRESPERAPDPARAPRAGDARGRSRDDGGHAAGGRRPGRRADRPARLRGPRPGAAARPGADGPPRRLRREASPPAGEPGAEPGHGRRAPGRGEAEVRRPDRTVPHAGVPRHRHLGPRRRPRVRETAALGRPGRHRLPGDQLRGEPAHGGGVLPGHPVRARDRGDADRRSCSVACGRCCSL